ncbi:MAG: hypothetical protein QG636_593 [Patescibacteria group bacterium]|nr:hypothetical protein [Patescibacteria group bacterium]
MWRTEISLLVSLRGHLERRQWWCIAVLTEVERIPYEIHEPPERHHNHKSDDAPHDELFSFVALLLVRSSSNEVLEHAPDEDDERYREEKRNEDITYKTDNAWEVDIESLSLDFTGWLTGLSKSDIR